MNKHTITIPTSPFVENFEWNIRSYNPFHHLLALFAVLDGLLGLLLLLSVAMTILAVQTARDVIMGERE